MIEIVSPSNKDRPETRTAFVAKVAALLDQGVCVSLVDVVTTSHFNLDPELMDFVDTTAPDLGNSPPTIYAATLRTRFGTPCRMLENWYRPLEIGRSLPTLPIWLTEQYAISLELEASYEETCRALRIR